MARLPVLLIFAVICSLSEEQSFAGPKKERSRISREEAILIAKAEAMRLKYTDSIEKITKTKVVIDPNEHNWSKDDQFNGQSFYKNSKLKHKKYWEIFFDVCCGLGNARMDFHRRDKWNRS